MCVNIQKKNVRNSNFVTEGGNRMIGDNWEIRQLCISNKLFKMMLFKAKGYSLNKQSLSDYNYKPLHKKYAGNILNQRISRDVKYFRSNYCTEKEKKGNLSVSTSLF
jgi:hypothetical protein